MRKYIIGYEGTYQIDEFGNIYNIKTNKQKTPWLDSQGRYYMIDLYKHNKADKRLVHRLVAEHFCERKNENDTVVDHLDKDTKNNYYKNLEWVTQQENIKRSYDTMDQIRNYKECALYKGNNLIDIFKSVAECARYCSDVLGLSYSSMSKYRKYKDYKIIKLETCNDYPVGE